LFEEKNMAQVISCLLHLKQLFGATISKDREGYKVVGGRADHFLGTNPRKKDVYFWRRNRFLRFLTNFPLMDWIISPLLKSTAAGFGIRWATYIFSYSRK